MADGSRQGLGFAHKRAVARYAFAVLAALVAVVLQFALTDEWEVSVYSILVGAVALAVWYGGVGPGIVGVVLAWGGAAAARQPKGSFGSGGEKSNRPRCDRGGAVRDCGGRRCQPRRGGGR